MHTETMREIVENGFNSKADVNYFFTTIRILLEDTKNNYKVIKFYSDWILHKKKDNLKEMYGYFEEIEKAFNIGEMWNKDIVNGHIEAITSFVDLREQLKKLLKYIGVNNIFLYDDSRWKIFSGFLRKLILNKPIVFKNLKLNSKYRKIELFVITETAPFMVGIEGELYWMIFINTSDFPYHGVIPESIGLSS